MLSVIIKNPEGKYYIQRKMKLHVPACLLMVLRALNLSISKPIQYTQAIILVAEETKSSVRKPDRSWAYDRYDDDMRRILSTLNAD